MDLEEAVRKAWQILDDERISPTSHYQIAVPDPKSATPPQMFKAIADQFNEVIPSNYNLGAQRKMRPRPVNEVRGKYEYTGINFNLLKVVLSHVAESERQTFIGRLAERIPTAKVHKLPDKAHSFPSFVSHTSELPLLAEFAIRTGYIGELFKPIISLDKWNAGLLLLLMQIEEMIALDFTVLSEDSLQTIPNALKLLLKKLRAATQAKQPARPRLPNESVVPQSMHSSLMNDIERVIGGIEAICTKALYLYLKGELQQKANLEINQDKGRVIGYLAALGFSKQMKDSLDAAEREYSAVASPFELKNSLGHLRSFLEHLHREAARSIAASSGGTLKDTWGGATLFLRDSGFISKQGEAFVTSLYTMISDDGVHPLVTEQEYARLFRNVVIEYGLMFLGTLDRKGVKLSR